MTFSGGAALFQLTVPSILPSFDGARVRLPATGLAPEFAEALIALLPGIVMPAIRGSERQAFAEGGKNLPGDADRKPSEEDTGVASGALTWLPVLLDASVAPVSAPAPVPVPDPVVPAVASAFVPDQGPAEARQTAMPSGEAAPHPSELRGDFDVIVSAQPAVPIAPVEPAVPTARTAPTVPTALLPASPVASAMPEASVAFVSEPSAGAAQSPESRPAVLTVARTEPAASPVKSTVPSRLPERAMPPAELGKPAPAVSESGIAPLARSVPQVGGESFTLPAPPAQDVSGESIAPHAMGGQDVGAPPSREFPAFSAVPQRARDEVLRGAAPEPRKVDGVELSAPAGSPTTTVASTALIEIAVDASPILSAPSGVTRMPAPLPAPSTVGMTPIPVSVAMRVEPVTSPHMEAPAPVFAARPSSPRAARDPEASVLPVTASRVAASPASPGQGTDTPVLAKDAAVAAGIPDAPVLIRAATTGSAVVAKPPARPEALIPAPPSIPLAEALAPLRRSAPRDSSVMVAVTPLAPEAPRQPSAPEAIDVAMHGQIDIEHDQWMATMVERIETLRDAAPVRETSLRLTPDALGTLDVTVVQDGDGIQVHFTTETAAARALIAEAQPRLTELAEARGLRITQTSVDAGAAGQGQGQGQRHEAGRPSAPPSARADARSESTDERIA